jgi:ribosomal protein S18 acetylase RimI-like enzyme
MTPLVLPVGDETSAVDGTGSTRRNRPYFSYKKLCFMSLVLCADYVHGFTFNSLTITQSNLKFQGKAITRYGARIAATRMEGLLQTVSEHLSSAIDTVPVQRPENFTFKSNSRINKRGASIDSNVTAVLNRNPSFPESVGNLLVSNDENDKVGVDHDEKSRLEQISVTRTVVASLFQKANGRSASSRRTSQTSVGDRRVGSASWHGDQGVRVTNTIMDVLRKTARGISSSVPSNLSETDPLPGNDRDPLSQDVSNTGKYQTSLAPSGTLSRISQSIIHSAIDEMLRVRRSAESTESIAKIVSSKDASQASPASAAFSSFHTRRMGILGDAMISKHPGIIDKEPITSCSYSMRSMSGASTTTTVNVRLATPADDVDVAYLRMSVFSDISPDLRSQFCARSCQAIAARRLRGAICFVATQNPSHDAKGHSRESIIGSAECSYHEFFGTKLGRRRQQNALMYITEVAVNPSVRRRGVGTSILQAIEIWAQLQSQDGYAIESLYLHVDVSNRNAIQLYEKAGFFKVFSQDPMFSEFTSVLNLQPGATPGREHYLLCKNLVAHPVWLNDQYDDPSVHTKLIASSGKHFPILGQFGIEIPA